MNAQMGSSSLGDPFPRRITDMRPAPRKAKKNKHEAEYEREYLDWYNGRSLGHAHQASFGNRSQLESDTLCGCFYCLRIYHPGHIHTWTLERNGKQTAWCPHCRIDSVLGASTGFPITPEFLGRMNKAYFQCGA